MARKRTAAEALQAILASVSDDESLEDDDPDFNASLENSSDESDAGGGEEYISSSGEESEDGGDGWIDVDDEFTNTIWFHGKCRHKSEYIKRHEAIRHIQFVPNWRTVRSYSCRN